MQFEGILEIAAHVLDKRLVQGRVVITPRPGVAITPSTRNLSGNDFYNTNHSEIGAGMTFITPSIPKSTWCYNHPVL